MAELFVGLLLAFLAGISTLAYKHPAAYREMWGTLCALMIAADFALFVWNAGALAMFKSAGPIIAADRAKFDALVKALEASQFPVEYAIGPVVGLAYFIFLRALPSLLQESDKK